MVKDMAEETQSASVAGENDAAVNGDIEENGDLENEIDEDLDPALFDDPEGFVDQISDEGLQKQYRRPSFFDHSRCQKMFIYRMH